MFFAVLKFAIIVERYVKFKARVAKWRPDLDNDSTYVWLAFPYMFIFVPIMVRVWVFFFGDPYDLRFSVAYSHTTQLFSPYAADAKWKELFSVIFGLVALITSAAGCIQFAGYVRKVVRFARRKS
jgi:hypothetical protein